MIPWYAAVAIFLGAVAIGFAAGLFWRDIQNHTSMFDSYVDEL